MADIKISELTEATTLDGTEDLVLVQGGVTKRIDAGNLMSDLESIKTEKVTFNSAAILGFGTATEVLAAPGAGKVIHVLSAYLSLRNGTASYQGATTPQMFIGTPSSIPATSAVSNFLANTAKFARMGIPTTTSYNFTKADFENKALNIVTSGGSPDTGDGILDVYITYQILSL